jgi:hypothetical protein
VYFAKSAHHRQRGPKVLREDFGRCEWELVQVPEDSIRLLKAELISVIGIKFSTPKIICNTMLYASKIFSISFMSKESISLQAHSQVFVDQSAVKLSLKGKSASAVRT